MKKENENSKKENVMTEQELVYLLMEGTGLSQDKIEEFMIHFKTYVKKCISQGKKIKIGNVEIIPDQEAVKNIIRNN